MPTIVVPLHDYKGPSGRTYIQGLTYEPETNNWFVTQADVVAGQSEQDVVFRRHDEKFKLIGTKTCKRGGHGSTTGVRWTAKGIQCIVGHNELGPGYFYWDNPGEFIKLKGIPNGDIAINDGHDLLCVRSGNRYRVYTLSSVMDGKPYQIVDGTIRDWFRRFQGHGITVLDDGKIALFVHRDVKTLGSSKVAWFNIKDGKLVQAGSVDTTGMGDEAEGVTFYDDHVWSTSRVGGNNSRRTVRATRLSLKTAKPGSVSFDGPGLPKKELSSVSVTAINEARESRKYSDHVWYVQKWLRRAGYDCGTPDGYWGTKTQAAMDNFRWSNRAALKFTDKKDGEGSVGVYSLALLNDKAKSSVKIKEEI